MQIAHSMLDLHGYFAHGLHNIPDQEYFKLCLTKPNSTLPNGNISLLLPRIWHNVPVREYIRQKHETNTGTYWRACKAYAQIYGRNPERPCPDFRHRLALYHRTGKRETHLPDRKSFNGAAHARN